MILKSEIKECFSDWYKDIDKDKHYTVLTNDIDSYLSCLFLKKKFGVEIGGFYDFEALYINAETTNGKTPIYVDADVTSGYAFGNHVTGLRNNHCVNLNKSIGVNNYTDKYAGSTLFTLYSLYDMDLTKYPRDKIQLLLTIDVWFKQFFCFRNKWDYWVKSMDMEYLTDIISEFSSTDYYDVLIDYKLNAEIKIMPDGTLFFPIDYDGIKEGFNMTIPTVDSYVFETKVQTLHIGNGDLYKMYQKKDRIFSNAMTYKNQLQYSFI